MIEFQPAPPRAVFHTTVKSAGEELSFWFETEGDEAVKRYLGCALMFAVPDEAVDEALESLADIFVYSSERLYLPPSPHMDSYHTRGTVVGRSTRPPLEVEG